MQQQHGWMGGRVVVMRAAAALGAEMGERRRRDSRVANLEWNHTIKLESLRTGSEAKEYIPPVLPPAAANEDVRQHPVALAVQQYRVVPAYNLLHDRKTASSTGVHSASKHATRDHLDIKFGPIK